MATPYEKIYEGFVKRKLVNDKKFFNYENISISDKELLVKDHSRTLMEQAIDEIYKYGNPQVNFYDKDDVTEQFNFDFINQEYGLLQDIMYFKYYEEGRNKLNSLGLMFKSSELNVFSPANERDSFLKSVVNIENYIANSIRNYLNRDRITWEMKANKFK